MHVGTDAWLLMLLRRRLGGVGAEPLAAVVEVEDEVYRFEAANNGAGPMWCSGSTCLVRVQDRLFASGLETLPQFRRSTIAAGRFMSAMTRSGNCGTAIPPAARASPAPWPLLPTGRCGCRANPTLTSPPQTAGPAQPQILRWRPQLDNRLPKKVLPGWEGTARVHGTFVSQPGGRRRRGRADSVAERRLRACRMGLSRCQGQWSAQGQLAWPWGGEYDQPQPIRICYPNVMLTQSSGAFLRRERHCRALYAVASVQEGTHRPRMGL